MGWGSTRGSISTNCRRDAEVGGGESGGEGGNGEEGVEGGHERCGHGQWRILGLLWLSNPCPCRAPSFRPLLFVQTPPQPLEAAFGNCPLFWF
jgi:hypothetical protein